MNVALQPTPSYQQHNWSQGCLMPVLAGLLRPARLIISSNSAGMFGPPLVFVYHIVQYLYFLRY